VEETPAGMAAAEPGHAAAPLGNLAGVGFWMLQGSFHDGVSSYGGDTQWETHLRGVFGGRGDRRTMCGGERFAQPLSMMLRFSKAHPVMRSSKTDLSFLPQAHHRVLSAWAVVNRLHSKNLNLGFVLWKRSKWMAMAWLLSGPGLTRTWRWKWQWG
jgi:hypothetical protein